MYNHERPHESLRGLTPATVYFQFRRHKKHYEL
jgi:transposase InsO family protein